MRVGKKKLTVLTKMLGHMGMHSCAGNDDSESMCIHNLWTENMVRSAWACTVFKGKVHHFKGEDDSESVGMHHLSRKDDSESMDGSTHIVYLS